jgi:hypothetical protein
MFISLFANRSFRPKLGRKLTEGLLRNHESQLKNPNAANPAHSVARRWRFSQSPSSVFEIPPP